MLSGLHSVLIWSEDVQRLLPFYRDVLGLRPLVETDQFAVFPAVGLRIGTHSEVSGLARDPNRVMVNFRVEDCQAEYERLAEQGVEFIRPPSPDAIHIVATLRDPDGNILQLMQDVVALPEALATFAKETEAER
jgi:predicted enzyme related to lactoylglutathione lyase